MTSLCHNIGMGAGKRFSAAVGAEDEPLATLEAAQAAVDDFVDGCGLDGRAAARLSVVVEEVIANALRHGGARRIAFALDHGSGGVRLSFEDDGQPFDPTAEREFRGPDTDTGGGVGLALIRSWGRQLRYTRNDGRNLLSLTLKLDR